jgi:hypothetical protein
MIFSLGKYSIDFEMNSVVQSSMQLIKWNVFRETLNA